MRNWRCDARRDAAATYLEGVKSCGNPAEHVGQLRLQLCEAGLEPQDALLEKLAQVGHLCVQFLHFGGKSKELHIPLLHLLRVLFGRCCGCSCPLGIDSLMLPRFQR